MKGRQEIEAQLRQETRDLIFNKQLASALAEKQAEREQNATKTYAEKVDWTKYTVRRSSLGQDPPNYRVAGDDKFKTLKWSNMLSDCAHYLDSPTLQDEIAMKKQLQTRYDDLFPTSVMRPPLQSRKDLLSWACAAQNSFMQAKEAPEDRQLQCDQYAALLELYGPNYTSLQKRLGHVRGLFD